MGTTTTALSVSRLKDLLARSFPGAEIRNLRRASRPGRIWGTLIWRSFRGKAQIDRQRDLWRRLEAELGPDELHEVGLILTVTPEEFAAHRRPAES